MPLYCWRQPLVLQVIVGQRAVGGIDTVMESHVQTGRCLAGARDADQYEIGAAVLFAAIAIVIYQGKIGRIDTRHVGGNISHSMRAPKRMSALLAEFGFQRHEKRLEEVEEQALR